MSDIDPERDAAWADLRARRPADPRPQGCDHTTCTKKKCKCDCHKTKVDHPTPTSTVPYSAALSPVLATVDRTKALLDVIRQHLPEVVQRANDDTDDGLKPASSGPPVTGGNDDPDLFNRAFRPIGKGNDTRWVAKTDRVRTSYTTLVTNLNTASSAITAAYNEIAGLRALTEDEARRLLAATDEASCKNCSRVVLNKGNDWLRRGRCSACNWYWDEHNVERPKELWDR